MLPPIDPHDPVGASRSPYVVDLVDLVLRFGTSPDRCRVLNGFLGFRAELHAHAMNLGFQWLNGSFLEDVGLLEGRSPGDIDVVTFLEPAGAFDSELRVFVHAYTRAQFRVDAYFVELNLPPEDLVSWTTCWYSVWSHRRNRLWKGCLQVQLSPARDATARERLQALISTGAL